MISICIPVYNYDVNPIIHQLLQQCELLPEFTEILIYDDASPVNVTLDRAHPLIGLHRGEENVGSVGSRAFLAAQASNNWALFIDADVAFPTGLFLKNYLNIINKKTLIYYGGVLYQEKKPKSDEILRWKYGREREIRKPLNQEQFYSYFVSCHFMIQRNLALELFKIDKIGGYGMDIYLSFYMRNEQIPILYFNNPVIHLGLESNTAYLKKSLEGIETTFNAERRGLIPNDFRPVQRVYLKIKKVRLLTLFMSVLKFYQKRLEKNVLSHRPKLIYLDLLKLYRYSILKQAN